MSGDEGIPEATPIALTADERATLEALSRSSKSEVRMRQRARIVLLAADGAATREISRQAGARSGRRRMRLDQRRRRDTQTGRHLCCRDNWSTSMSNISGGSCGHRRSTCPAASFGRGVSLDGSEARYAAILRRSNPLGTSDDRAHSVCGS